MYVQNVEKRHLPPLESLISGVEGETIIVTGPTSGIGRETAANLALAGAKGWIV